MSFKKLSILMLVLTTSGCSWLRDKPRPASEIKSAALDLSCLQEAPIQLQNLFLGNYTASEEDKNQVRSIWKCLDHSLTTFSERTRGGKSGVYGAAELQLFANRFLPPEKPLSPEFTSAIFRLKQAVLGGSDNEVTQDEILRLKKKLNAFGDMILPLSQYMSVLLKPPGQDSDGKEEAAVALNTFVLNVADLLSDSINPLQWLDLNDFVGELEKYTRIKNKPTALTYVHEQLGVYQYFKLLLVGGNEFAIENTKWRPIFEAISHFYNALSLSSNTVETLDQLSIEVQSTEVEQQKAVDKLNALFVTLREDRSLSSINGISKLADRWGKALVLNAVVFPRSQGSLALKTFLGSPGLRKLAGYLLDQVKAIQANTNDSANIQALADNLVNFIVQASVENSQGGILTPIAFGPLTEYVQKLKPLFSNDKEYQSLLLAFDLFKNAAPILCGKESDSYLPKDLKVVVQKSVDLYFAWRKESKLSIYEAIGVSFDVILRSPGIFSAKSEQVEHTVQIVRKLMAIMEIRTTLNWDLILGYARGGFQLKSLLFGNSDRTINAFEVKTISDLWVPFRKGDDLVKSLRELSILLQSNTFTTVPFDKLVAAINRFLPKTEQSNGLGIDAKTLGLLKSVLIGGSETELAAKDYAPLIKVAANFVERLKPYQSQLNQNFKFGLNAKSMEISAAAIDAFADSVSRIENLKIKALLKATTERLGYTVQETTLNKFVIGLTHRMLGRQTTPKPRRVSGVVTAAQIRAVIPLMKQIQKDFEELEGVFKGANSLDREQLFSRIKSNDIKHIVSAFPPILKTTEQLIYFTGQGARNDFGAYDVTYRTMLLRALGWLFPAYQIEKDSGKASGRLTYNDVVDLLEDINSLLPDLKLTFGVNTPEEAATKRMQSINIFTKSGNGDEYLDIDETVEFLTISVGGRTLLDKTLARLVSECKFDLKTGKIPYTCLTEKFSEPTYFADTYGIAVPEMARQFLKYTPEERAVFVESVFNATDASWRSKKEMTLSDFEVFVAVPYYAESIFERLDVSHDQVVNFSESMAGFPLFCREIKKAAGSSVKGSCITGEYPGQIEAVYGHLLFKGEAPRGPKPGDSIWRKAVEIKRVLGWFRYWKRLYRDPDYRNSRPPLLQRKDLIKIISNLAMATDAPQLDVPDESEIDASSASELPDDVPPELR